MELLEDWCSEHFSRVVQLSPLSGDAGNRCYFRLNNNSINDGDNRWLAVYAPPTTEKNHEWAQMQQLLRAARVRVPTVRAVDMKLGYWLIEDVGDSLLYNALLSANEDEVDCFYHYALSVLLRIQNIKPPQPFPRHAGSELIAELDLCREWFIGNLLHCPKQANEESAWENVSTVLLECFETSSWNRLCLEHGDFQSKNLLITPDDDMVVIDFQDAALGLASYDLCSLLQDCYVKYPRHKVLDWLSYYWRSGCAKGIWGDKDMSDHDNFVVQFVSLFDYTGLQRHLRVLGTFSRLHLKDKKSHYLMHVPRILEYIDETLDLYPTLQGFADYWKGIRVEILKHNWSDPTSL